MDRQTIEDQHIVARYLAGQLSEAESVAFEAHYARNADTVRDIERMLRFKEGLAVLEERGQLDALTHRRNYWQPGLGLAAGIAVLIVGVWLWIGQTSVAPVLTDTIAALVDQQGKPLHIASTYILVRTRGPAASLVDVPLPSERSAIELRMFPSVRPENGKFRVIVGQLDAANAVAPIAETRAVANASDGFVTAYLDSAKLTRGRYVVDLLPQSGGSSGPPEDRFILELR